MMAFDILLWGGMTFLLVVLAFCCGYTRGIDELSSYRGWGIGFDEGWKAGAAYARGEDAQQDSEETP